MTRTAAPTLLPLGARLGSGRTSEQGCEASLEAEGLSGS